MTQNIDLAATSRILTHSVLLTAYDWILVNSSAGKDSQAMLDLVVELARASGVADRVVVVHADLGRVEWKGTRELAELQARHYGARFEVVRRGQNDLLDHVRARGKWPSSTARYCTSDHKRGPVRTLMTRLADEWRRVDPLPRRRIACRILNCMGLRAKESAARANCTVCKGKSERPASAGRRWVPVELCKECRGTGGRVAFTRDNDASNGRRTVYTWLPIHSWTLEQVWDRIHASGVPYHWAYDIGMPRLSCAFCVFAPEAALMLAGQHNRELLDEYVAVENEIGHAFQISGKRRVYLRVLRDRLDAGERTKPTGDDGCWNM